MLKSKVGDFFIRIATPGYIDLKSKKLNSLQLSELDSILIYTENELLAGDRALRRADPTEDRYPRIRELVVDDKNQAALVALAKYQNENDLELILHNRQKSKFAEGGFYHTYLAISAFPHSVFFPLLENNLRKTLDNTHYGTEWRALYRAIASYQNNEALELLRIPFTQVKYKHLQKYHYNFILGALSDFKSPVFDNLLWKLWREESKVAPDVFEYLDERYPDKTYELVKESLEDTNEFYRSSESLGDAENLVARMLDLVVKEDESISLEILVNSISHTNVHLFPIFAERVAEIQDRSFIDPLFNRLETESNPNIYLVAAKALIALNSDQVNLRILETVEKNDSLTQGWGGEAFDNLLKESRIK